MNIVKKYLPIAALIALCMLDVGNVQSAAAFKSLKRACANKLRSVTKNSLTTLHKEIDKIHKEVKKIEKESKKKEDKIRSSSLPETEERDALVELHRETDKEINDAHECLVDLLRKKNPNNSVKGANYTPLMHAVAAGCARCVRIISSDRRTDPNVQICASGGSFFHKSWTLKLKDKTSTNIFFRGGMTALHDAARLGNVPAVSCILNALRRRRDARTLLSTSLGTTAVHEALIGWDGIPTAKNDFRFELGPLGGQLDCLMRLICSTVIANQTADLGICGYHLVPPATKKDKVEVMSGTALDMCNKILNHIKGVLKLCEMREKSPDLQFEHSKMYTPELASNNKYAEKIYSVMKMVLENPEIAPGVLSKKGKQYPLSVRRVYQMDAETMQKLIDSPYESLDVTPYEAPRKVSAQQSLQQWLASRGLKPIFDDVVYSAQQLYSTALNADAFVAYVKDNPRPFKMIPYVRIINRTVKSMRQEMKREELMACQEGCKRIASTVDEFGTIVRYVLGRLITSFEEYLRSPLSSKHDKRPMIFDLGDDNEVEDVGELAAKLAFKPLRLSEILENRIMEAIQLVGVGAASLDTFETAELLFQYLEDKYEVPAVHEEFHKLVLNDDLLGSIHRSVKAATQATEVGTAIDYYGLEDEDEVDEDAVSDDREHDVATNTVTIANPVGSDSATEIDNSFGDASTNSGSSPGGKKVVEDVPTNSDTTQESVSTVSDDSAGREGSPPADQTNQLLLQMLQGMDSNQIAALTKLTEQENSRRKSSLLLPSLPPPPTDEELPPAYSSEAPPLPSTLPPPLPALE